MNTRFVQRVATCPAAIRRFVPWVTLCFLKQRKNKVEKPLEPTQQELVVIASEQAGFSKRVDIGHNSSEQERFVMLVEESPHRITNNLLNINLLKGLES